jgi:hypothetical protein
MPKFSKMIAVLLAYALSSLGLLWMVVLIIEELRRPKVTTAIVLVWLAAWFVHIVMSVAWVQGKRLSRIWPKVGLIAGIGSFLVWPILASKGQSPLGPAIAAASAGQLMAVQAVLVAPCLVLAIWLVRFHWKEVAPAATSSVEPPR